MEGMHSYTSFSEDEGRRQQRKTHRKPSQVRLASALHSQVIRSMFSLSFGIVLGTWQNTVDRRTSAWLC